MRWREEIRYASCVWELPMPTTFRAYQPLRNHHFDLLGLPRLYTAAEA